MSDGGPGVSSTRRLGAGRWSRLPITLHVCILTGGPWRHCPVFCAPILLWRRSIVQRRPTAIPRPIVWGLIGHCASPVSPVAPQPFCDVWVHHRPLCWLIDGVPALVGNSVRGQPAIASPLFAPTPTMELLWRREKVRTRAKSRVSNLNVRSCECVVNLQQIDRENSIIGCMFSKPVTGSKTG